MSSFAEGNEAARNMSFQAAQPGFTEMVNASGIDRSNRQLFSLPVC